MPYLCRQWMASGWPVVRANQGSWTRSSDHAALTLALVTIIRTTRKAPEWLVGLFVSESGLGGRRVCMLCILHVSVRSPAPFPLPSCKAASTQCEVGTGGRVGFQVCALAAYSYKSGGAKRFELIKSTCRDKQQDGSRRPQDGNRPQEDHVRADSG